MVPVETLDITVKISFVNADLEVIEENYGRIYLDGIPKLIEDGTAFLSFICTVTGTEALCGYRYGDAYKPPKIGLLFKEFITSYYPKAYHPYVDDLWELRNKLVHAFSTGRFLLTHRHSERHLSKSYSQRRPIAPLSSPGLGWSAPIMSTGAPVDFRYVTDLSGPISPTGSFVGEPSIILNAEDFYAALTSAANQFFAEVRASVDLQLTMKDRLANSKGGAVEIKEIP